MTGWLLLLMGSLVLFHVIVLNEKGGMKRESERS